jgi:hypothetical protein
MANLLTVYLLSEKYVHVYNAYFCNFAVMATQKVGPISFKTLFKSRSIYCNGDSFKQFIYFQKCSCIYIMHSTKSETQFGHTNQRQ